MQLGNTCKPGEAEGRDKTQIHVSLLNMSHGLNRAGFNVEKHPVVDPTTESLVKLKAWIKLTAAPAIHCPDHEHISIIGSPSTMPLSYEAGRTQSAPGRSCWLLTSATTSAALEILQWR